MITPPDSSEEILYYRKKDQTQSNELLCTELFMDGMYSLDISHKKTVFFRPASLPSGADVETYVWRFKSQHSKCGQGRKLCVLCFPNVISKGVERRVAFLWSNASQNIDLCTYIGIL